MGEQIGILAAIKQAQVPISSRSGKLPINTRSVNDLRTALSTELKHVLDVAAPKPVVIKSLRAARRGKKVAQDVKAAVDALDELMERAANLDGSEEEEPR
jgi:hypothetical protein